MRIKRYNESNSNINKVNQYSLKYFELFPLLRGLESERPGIKDRIWKWMCDERDAAFRPYNGRISSINLFFYGIGDEYPTEYLKKYPSELEHSKKIHPDAFVKGDIMELRIDLNLIQSVYEDQIDDIGSFYVKVFW